MSNQYSNPFSFIVGCLCYAVVYMHSNWTNGFNILTIGIESHTLKQITSLILHLAVPSFFIIWGYLSNKYLYNEEKPIRYLKSKLIKFYPIYFVSFCLALYLKSNSVDFPVWKIILAGLGLYYESGFRGGNIFLVVLYVLLTVSILKYFNLNKLHVFIWSILCLVMTKVLPHSSEICYIRYFGYYTAFWVGVNLKELLFFEKNHSPLFLFILISFSLFVSLINKFGIYFLEIQYQPNSPEQLLLCVVFLYLAVRLMIKYPLHQKKSIIPKIINQVGNNAYGHFIWQYYIINLIIFIGSIWEINLISIQIFIILFASPITVFGVVIPLNKFLTNIVFKRSMY